MTTANRPATLTDYTDAVVIAGALAYNMPEITFRTTDRDSRYGDSLEDAALTGSNGKITITAHGDDPEAGAAITGLDRRGWITYEITISAGTPFTATESLIRNLLEAIK